MAVAVVSKRAAENISEQEGLSLNLYAVNA